MTMVTANGVELKMEVNTGASVSIISEYTYNKLRTHNMPPLQETILKLRTYTGETLQIHGAITVDVTYNDHTDTLLSWTVSQLMSHTMPTQTLCLSW